MPYPRYDETVEGVVADIEAMGPAIAAGLTREALQGDMPPGAARNALDCALWDFEAKRSGIRAHVTAGVLRLPPVTTAYTISLDTPDAMAEAATRAQDRPILKIKLGAPEDDIARIRAVRRAVPGATLIADANEGWRESNLDGIFAACAEAGFALIEQPLPAGRDGALARRFPARSDLRRRERSRSLRSGSTRGAL